MSDFILGMVAGLLGGATVAALNAMFWPDATMAGLALALLVTALAWAVLPLVKRAVRRHLRRRGVD
jgi:hypothetical protein